MTRVRRLLGVAAFLAAVAVLSSSQLRGDSKDRKDRPAILPKNDSRPLLNKNGSEDALAKSKFEQGGVLSYLTTAGDNIIAFGVKPPLDPTPRRPRDYLLL